MITDIEKVFCINAYIFTKSFLQTRRPFVKRFNIDHRKTHLAPSNAAINNCVKQSRGSKMFKRKQDSGGPRLATSNVMVTKAEESVLKSPERSAMHKVQSLGINKRTALKTFWGEHPKKVGEDIAEQWFQQDRVVPHTAARSPG